jgi:hypothetical protein
MAITSHFKPLFPSRCPQTVDKKGGVESLNQKSYQIEETTYFEQKSRETQYENAMDHGEIASFVNMKVEQYLEQNPNSNVDMKALKNQFIDEFLRDSKAAVGMLNSFGAKGFTAEREDGKAHDYSHLKESESRFGFYCPVTEARPVVGDDLPPATHWETVFTPGTDNNCGIFAMNPHATPQEARKIRANFVGSLRVSHEAGKLTDVDYRAMLANLEDGALSKQYVSEGMSRELIYRKYVSQVHRGDFLDIFALRRIAEQQGKHLVVIYPRSKQDRTLTLDEIRCRALTHLPDDFQMENILVITHDGKDHFQTVKER